MWKTSIAIFLVNAAILLGYLCLSHEPSHPSKNKAGVEVVVSHYNEDLSWVQQALKKTPHVRYTIYSKSNDTPEGALALPNVGRESHTFLYHIVKNYNSLADWTVFTQAASPSFGFRVHNENSGHMNSGVTWDNYIESQGSDWYMVQTVATRFPEIAHSDRFDMIFQIPSSKGEVCPLDPEEGWGMWWSEPSHPVVQMQMSQKEPFLPPVEFYNKYIVADSSKYFDEFTLNYANGGRFAASRARIHRRPIGYYKDLLEQLSKSVNPIEGYYMESMWFDVFHPERLQAEYGPVCKVRELPAEDVPEHSVMFDEAKARFERVMLRDYGEEETHPRDLLVSGGYRYLVSSPYLLPSTGGGLRKKA